MNNIIVLILSNAHHAKDLGLLITRVGLGLIFTLHGWPKVMGGTESWMWLGSQMSIVGITFFPLFWGLVSALTEFLGGALLAVGLGTRIVSFLLAFQMLVALFYHLNKGDNFTVYSHPLSLLVVFVALMVSGAGYYSLDVYLK